MVKFRDLANFAFGNTIFYVYVQILGATSNELGIDQTNIDQSSGGHPVQGGPQTGVGVPGATLATGPTAQGSTTAQTAPASQTAATARPPPTGAPSVTPGSGLTAASNQAAAANQVPRSMSNSLHNMGAMPQQQVI